MYVALDVYYGETFVRGAYAGFATLEQSTPAFMVTKIFDGAAADYQPGNFRIRELPYLEQLVCEAIQTTKISTVIIDGYVWLGETRKGLGWHLYESMQRHIPVIGVAKTRFHQATATPILRGMSNSALWITAIGVDVVAAANVVQQMHGEFRMPTMLTLVDQASRGR
jgi:deoxyribonuclease V